MSETQHVLINRGIWQSLSGNSCGQDGEEIRWAVGNWQVGYLPLCHRESPPSTYLPTSVSICIEVKVLEV